MPQFFIHRPVFAWVIALFIVLLGVLAIPQLPISRYPTVAPPTVSLYATYPGATPKTLNDSVVSLIERELSSVRHLLYFESSVDTSGSAEIKATFKPGTNPELAQVGLTEAEARAAGHRVTLLRAPLAENDRAVAEGDVTGLVKLVIAGNRVLGAGILAPHAGEMIGQWTLAIGRRVPLTALAGLIVPYPTRAEAGKRALASLFAPRLFAPRTKSLVRLLIRLP